MVTGGAQLARFDRGLDQFSDSLLDNRGPALVDELNLGRKGINSNNLVPFIGQTAGGNGSDVP